MTRAFCRDSCGAANQDYLSANTTPKTSTISCAAGLLATVSLCVLPKAEVFADDGFRDAAVDVVLTRVMPKLNEPFVLETIRQMNVRNRDLTEDDLVRMDGVWRQQTLSAEQPLIDSVLSNDVSRYLHRIRSESDGLLTEIFIMDMQGLNVGQSDVTSDYWQGDEAKWQKTCGLGPGAIFVDQVEEDESTQQFQSQVSVSIDDPETQALLGCVTVGVDVELVLEARS